MVQWCMINHPINFCGPFQVKMGYVGSWFSFGPSPPAPELNFWRISGMGFLWARYPAGHPTNNVKALKETQNTNPNQEALPTGHCPFSIHHQTQEGRDATFFTPELTDISTLAIPAHSTQLKQTCCFQNEKSPNY